MAAYTIVPIEHNIKQAITAAVKAVEFKKYHVEADEVVDNLLADIFRSLFPHNPSLVNVDKVEIQIPIVPPAKEKKPRAKKEIDTGAGAPAAAASADAAPKKPRAKKEKKEENLTKINPSQKKALAKISDKLDQKEFLTYVNGLTAEEYSAKTFEEHAQDFVKPNIVEEEFVKREMLRVPFEGKDYFVDPKTREIYVEEEGGVDRKVGNVGMLEFAEMKIPE